MTEAQILKQLNGKIKPTPGRLVNIISLFRTLSREEMLGNFCFSF